MNSIHRLVDRAEDRFGLRTHHFAAAHRVAFDAFLLALCAVPGVSGWRSLVAALLVNALRLRAAETGRRKASIIGRAKEAGLVVDPVAWRAIRDGLPEFVLAGPKGYAQFCWGTAGWVDDVADATRMTYDDAWDEWARGAQAWFDVEIKHERGGTVP